MNRSSRWRFRGSVGVIRTIEVPVVGPPGGPSHCRCSFAVASPARNPPGMTQQRDRETREDEGKTLLAFTERGLPGMTGSKERRALRVQRLNAQRSILDRSLASAVWSLPAFPRRAAPGGVVGPGPAPSTQADGPGSPARRCRNTFLQGHLNSRPGTLEKPDGWVGNYVGTSYVGCRTSPSEERDAS